MTDLLDDFFGDAPENSSQVKRKLPQSLQTTPVQTKRPATTLSAPPSATWIAKPKPTPAPTPKPTPSTEQTQTHNKPTFSQLRPCVEFLSEDDRQVRDDSEYRDVNLVNSGYRKLIDSSSNSRHVYVKDQPDKEPCPTICFNDVQRHNPSQKKIEVIEIDFNNMEIYFITEAEDVDRNTYVMNHSVYKFTLALGKSPIRETEERVNTKPGPKSGLGLFS